jgi:hypothetical protein
MQPPCSHTLLLHLAGSRERYAGVCPACGWELLLVRTVTLDGRHVWRVVPLRAPTGPHVGP